MSICKQCEADKNIKWFSGLHSMLCNTCKLSNRSNSIKHHKISSFYQWLFRQDEQMAKSRKWKQDNKEKYLARKREYEFKRRSADSLYEFKQQTRNLINEAFNKCGTIKSVSSEVVLGCTLIEFRNYIESKFMADMSFDNRSLWHLDHIIPLATATTRQDVINLNHYTNFQPLWATHNLKKGSKVA